MIVAIANVITKENDTLPYVADDYIDIVLAVVALGVYALWRNKTSLQDLRKANNVATVLAVLLILATIFAIT